MSTASTNNNHSVAGLKSNYDTDVVRLIGQHLVSLGLKQTVESLLQECGLEALDHPVATKFQHYILAGDWDMATQLVDELANFSHGDKSDNRIEMQILIAEQKFLELVEDNQLVKALKCLRLELSPKLKDEEHIRHLANLLVCTSSEDLRSKADWQGKGLQSRQCLIEKFQRFIPPMIMLPQKRLKTLLSQAVQLQRDQCTLHPRHPEIEYVDLKTDHVCSIDKFPFQPKQEIHKHKTEIWYCKFSNDGTKLATGAVGGKVKIWDVNPNDRSMTERCNLDCDCYHITCLAWSPDDVHLLVCGSEEKGEIWLWNVEKVFLQKINLLCPSNHSQSDDERATTCSWHPSGKKFAAASTKGNFRIYDLDGEIVGSREGVRVQCLSFLHKDPSLILAADHLRRIKSYAIKNMSLATDEDDILEENQPIMSFVVDYDDKYIAVNCINQGVHLWDFRLKTLLRIFAGVCQRNFTIHPTFSSPSASLLASGSEDGKIFIYRTDRNDPVAVLHGHSRCVNCVTWNPKYPELLVSVSDDRFIRLWAPM